MPFLSSLPCTLAAALSLLLSPQYLANAVAPQTSTAAWSMPPLPQSASSMPLPSRSLHRRQCRPSTFLSSTTESAPASDNMVVTDDDGTTKKKKAAAAWYPVRPVDALPGGADKYDAVVKSAYIRHVLVETADVADLALKVYLKGSSGGTIGESNDGGDDEGEGDRGDAFARLAKDLSACPLSRDGGGRVGWVDNPAFPGKDINSSSNGGGMISPEAIERLFQRRLKGGDVLKIPAAGGGSGSDEGGMWHLIRVDDVSIHFDVGEISGKRNSEDEGARVGSQSQNGNLFLEKRPKLKGSGIAPLAPRFERRLDDDEEDEGKLIEEGDEIEGLAKYYHIATSGCQMNVADSERLAGVLEHELGMTDIHAVRDSNDSNDANGRSPRRAKPDVVILNTCTIRDHAEQKVYDALGPHAQRKRSGDRVAIVVAGCVAQQEGAEILRRFPEVDLVMGPQYIHRLGDLLEEVGRGGQLVATDPTLWSEDWTNPAVRGGSGVRAWVNVINGCNEHCTYCVVPAVRGVEQSRSMENILRECLSLADAGYKEVTLLGQNIDAYGRDMVPRRNFADLLQYLNENIPPNTIERVRYVTSHPRYFSERVIDAVASLDKVCECFHMPFQAGDDDVLRNMRRGYTYDSYMAIINNIKAAAPDASICGDVIVGFPGETDEQFQRTLDLMEEVHFDNLNTFAYSPRPNTEAALMEEDDALRVSEDVKSDRLQQVQRLAATHAMERSERYMGRTIPVLVEDRNPKNVDQVMGRTRQGRAVFFDGDVDELRGQTVDVEVVEARTWSLMGKLVGQA